MQSIDEAKMLAQIQNLKTKEKGFHWLMNAYKENLYWQIYALLQNHTDTADVLQNTFIKVWKYIGSFKQNAKLSTWLYTIAKNESIAWLNKNARIPTQKISEEKKQMVFNQLEDNGYAKENTILEQLSQAINTLPKRQKEVFHLRYFQEMKYSQMAKNLKVSESALKASYHQAVKKIETFLKHN